MLEIAFLAAVKPVFSPIQLPAIWYQVGSFSFSTSRN